MRTTLHRSPSAMAHLPTPGTANHPGYFEAPRLNHSGDETNCEADCQLQASRNPQIVAGKTRNAIAIPLEKRI